MVRRLLNALHQPLAFQRAQGVAAQAPLADQGMGQPVWMLRQHLHRLLLFGRAGDGRVLRVGAGQQLPELILARQRRLALAQQHRQRHAQGVAQAVLVIARGPLAQAPETVGQHRGGVKQGFGGLQAVVRHLGVVADGGNQANHRALAKWHANPLPDVQVSRTHAPRCAVVEQPAQGRGQGYLQNGSGHTKHSMGRGADGNTDGRKTAVLASWADSVIIAGLFSGQSVCALCVRQVRSGRQLLRAVPDQVDPVAAQTNRGLSHES